MNKRPSIKTHALMTRVDASEGEAFEEVCAAEGVSPAEGLRRLVRQKLGHTPARQADAAEAHLWLYVKTMGTMLKDEDLLTAERFKDFVKECAPGLVAEAESA